MVIEAFRSSELAVRSVCDFGSRACVVTFGSYTDDRSLDRRGFGEEFFQVRSIDAIHVISRENDWYQHPEMPAVAAGIAELTRGYERVVAYGSSMGAYGAIRFGGMAGASAALAVSPQFSIDPRTAGFERRWKYDSERIDFRLERTLKAPFVESAYLVYDPRGPDRRHADLYRRRTRVLDVSLPGVGHPATGFIAEAGLLTDLVLDFVADELDVAELQRKASLAREASPQFYYVKSERALLGRSRVAYAGRAAAMAPHNVGFVTHYASMLAACGRFDEAQIVFARAAAVVPDHPLLLRRLSEFHERRGDIERAIEAAELLVSLHSQAFLPRLDELRRRRERLRHWPTLTIRGLRIAGDPALPIDVRVTTTPSPPPFVESWRRHESLMAARPDGPIDLMLLGDSLIEYWPENLWAPLRAFNFGVKADKTQHALWRLEQLPAGSVDCRHVVILLGANNLGAGDTATGIAAGIAAVVAGVVRVAPKARILVIATPPIGSDQQFRVDVRRRANRALAGLEGFETLDVDGPLLSDRAERSRYYQADGIHFSDAGYRLLTDLIRARLS